MLSYFSVEYRASLFSMKNWSFKRGMHVNSGLVCLGVVSLAA